MAMLDKGVPIATPSTTFTTGIGIGTRTAGFSTATEYTNYTAANLYIKTQNNLTLAIDPNKRTVSSEENRPHLEIKMRYTLHNNAGILATYDLVNTMVQNDMLQGPEAEKLRERLLDMYAKDASRDNKMDFSFIIYKRILEDDIRRHKLVMIRECNILAAQEPQYLAAPHPYSNEGLQQVEVSNNKLYFGQAGVFLKVVDNECLAKQRFFYSGKQLITVPSCLDDAKESGVYCTVSTMDEDGQVTPRTSFMTFEEAQTNIGLYRTQEEAITNGDPEMALKVEEANHRREEKKLARELAELRSSSERENLRLEGEVSRQRTIVEELRSLNTRLKEEAEHRKTMRDEAFDVKKQLRADKSEKRKDKYERKDKARKDYYDRLERERKDTYERRSHERKDWSELVKFIPGLVIGVLGAFALARRA